ncbi:PLP-dependent aminotransferase family protein [Amycolatopsis sp. NPDC050768]|uniref:aminotransferase-like domain-containing protein n=1 Tax=Amycolatopsis sp. NPDC050768 TaxID=3154839 RepID=UPI0033DC9D4F
MPPSEGRVEPARLARMLGDWPSNDRGLARALALGISQLITDSHLADGALLPSQRKLAEALGVSRSTVTEAYEALVAADVVESFQRSGCRVRRKGFGAIGADQGAAPVLGPDALASYDIARGALPGLPTVADAIAGIDRRRLMGHVAAGGFFPAGLPELRDAVAAYYANLGTPTTRENILITGGAQQATWLVAQLLIGPVDEVVVEDPTSRRTLDVLRRAGTRLLPVPFAGSALRLDLLEQLVTRRRPRLVYCQPVVHDPTGLTMDARSLRTFARILDVHHTFCVEDASSAELLFADERRPGLAALLPPDQHLTVSTLSKLTWGGLRVGWIRGSVPVIERLTELKRSIDLTSSVLDQLVAVDLLQRLPDLRALRTADLRGGYEIARRVLTRVRPDWRWTEPSGGTGLWVDTGADAGAIGSALRSGGVRALTGFEHFSPFGGLGTYLSLPLWYSEEHLEPALRALDRILPAQR